MAIIKWEPMSELDRFFDDRLFPSFSFPSLSSKLGWDLAVDLFEEGNSVVAKMTLPGINPTDLDISVEDDTLRIQGRREEEQETKKKNYYSKEIRRGSFSRVVGLPKRVDSAKVAAEYKDGVLKITMPVVGKLKGEAVKVKVAS
jgi:HSP20 family protein